MRHQITEAEAERLIDRRVLCRIAVDRACKHAEDAESQAAREEAITQEVEAEVYRKYEVYDHGTFYASHALQRQD